MSDEIVIKIGNTGKDKPLQELLLAIKASDHRYRRLMREAKNEDSHTDALIGKFYLLLENVYPETIDKNLGIRPKDINESSTNIYASNEDELKVGNNGDKNGMIIPFSGINLSKN